MILKYDLSGRNAIITGGANGISFEVARGLCNSGARSIIFDIDENGGNAAVKELRDSGFEAEFRKLDMTRDELVSEVVSDVISKFGHIDTLFNGAGIMDSKPLAETDTDSFRRVLNVNLFGVYSVTRAVLGNMMKNGYGRIINVTSAYSNGVRNAIGYAASKGAITSLTRSLAAEMKALDLDITANAISPPATDTALWRRTRSEEVIRKHLEMKDVGKPGDMVATVLFLAAPESFFVSGEVIGHKYSLMKAPDSRQ